MKADATFVSLVTRLETTDKNCKFVHVFVHNLMFALKADCDLDQLLNETQVLRSNIQLPQLLKLLFDGLHSDRPDHPLEEPSEHSTAIFEWKCAIIKLLFDYPKKSAQPPVVQTLLELCPTKQIELVHLLGLLLEKTISSQSTPSLIKDRHPAIASINEMYAKPYSHGFQLHMADVDYLLQLFDQKLEEFKLRSAGRIGTTEIIAG